MGGRGVPEGHIAEKRQRETEKEGEKNRGNHLVRLSWKRVKPKGLCAKLSVARATKKGRQRGGDHRFA